MNNKPFIGTASGARFYVDDLNVEDIPIYDVAHALSMNCRYNGHVRDFYSVAEHSVIISHLVPPEDALWGLLHDVTEAFVPDIPRPFKPFIGGFKEYEDRIQAKVMGLHGLPLEEPESVAFMDHNIVYDEAKQLFAEVPDWIDNYKSVGAGPMIVANDPRLAKQHFLDRYMELT